MADMAPTVEELASAKPSDTFISLPPTVEGLLEQRKNPRTIKLHDRVERIYLSMYPDPNFRRLRDAVYRENTVEGDFISDDISAAIMIRERAKTDGDIEIAKQKLSVIRKSMSVVEHRYNAHRSKRRGAGEA